MYMEREWLTPYAVRYLRADKSRTGFTAHRLEGGGWRLELPDGAEHFGRHAALADVEQEIANIALAGMYPSELASGPVGQVLTEPQEGQQ